MAKNEEDHILNIQVSYDKAVEGIKTYRGEIEKLKAREKELAQELEDGKISQQEYDKELEIGKVAQKNYKDEIRALQKEIQNNIRQEQQLEGSLKSLRAELSNATKKYDEMSRAERNSAKGKELQEHIKNITAELKGAEEETDRFYRNVGNYKNSIIEALTGNNKFASSLAGLTQQGGGVQGFFTSAVTSVKSFGAALMGLMSNPVFLGIAGIAGAGVAFKWFYDYNQGLAEATRLTREFTGLAGDELVSVRNGIQAVADTMGHDYKDTLSTVDALMSNYGITAQQATKVVEDGFVSGADLSGDMLAKIQQYAPTFHDAGIGASEMVAILQQTRSGIFSDKGLDVITMASKKIREMATGTKDALTAIGVDVTKVQQDLANGTRSTFDVIQEVSTKMKAFGANSEQVGDVLKNVFGKQSAEAGIKLIEQLDTMSTDIEEVKKQTGEWGEAQQEQIKATTELNGAMSALFDLTDNGWETMIDQVKLIATKWLTAVVKGCIDIANWFVRLYNKSLIVRAGVQNIIAQFKQLWTAAKLVVNLIIDNFKMIGRGLEAFVDTTKAAFRAVIGAAQGFGRVLSGIANFSFDEIKAGVADMKNSVVGGFKSTLSTLKNTVKATASELWGDIANFGKETYNNFKDGFNAAVAGGGLKEIKIQAGIEGTGGENADNSAVSANNGAGSTTTGSSGKNATGGKKDKNKSAAPTAEQLTADELAQVRKAEELLLQLIEDNTEKQRALLNQKYDEQIADLQRALAEKGKHTAKAEQAITVQINALQQQRNIELNKLELQFTKQRVEQENKKYALLIEAAKAGTREQYDLQLAKLANEQELAQAEIVATITNEQQQQEMILANDAAFAARRLELKKKYLQDEHAAQQQAITEQFANDIQGAEQGGDELGALQLKLEQKRAMMDAANAADYESEKAKQDAILQASNEFYEAQQALSDKRRDIEIANNEAIAGAIGNLQGVMEAFGNKNKTLTVLSKMLALAQISIQTGVALAKGIAQAQSVPYPANISAIATTVGTILANIATAVKTVQGAKMATGGMIRGRGTGTSDQVPIQASNGESMMTAAATSMFSPALSAFNQLGGGVPIVVQSPAQQQGEEFLAAAFAKGMALAPRPVVTVEEINKVQERVEVLEQLGNI
jgi:FtsZ-binding cell division protein ZapB